MNVKPHDRFSAEYSLTPKVVADYALSVGDKNPIHHDPNFAAKTRYGRLIASGTHTTALILGLTASHFSKTTSMVLIIGSAFGARSMQTRLSNWNG